MRADWNRRVKHDYRFWMTESHNTDAAMWSSGARDSSVLLTGIERPDDKIILEIGCGVGRLLRSVSERFRHVIGFDVSTEAIKKAGELLKDRPNVELFVGDGFSLNPLADKSIDVAYSFAAITSMPVDIAASYLQEANRVLKTGGILRMQMYLGEEQIVSGNDTLHLRCYKRENLAQAARAAGFAVDYIEELILPFKVSFKEIGIEAVVVSLKKEFDSTPVIIDISERLLPGGEKETDENTGREIECWMSLNYAQDLADRGEVERAKEALEYAQSFVRSCSIDVSDLLNKVVDTIALKNGTDNVESSGIAISELYERNFEILQRRFPAEARKLAAQQSLNIKLKETAQGTVIHYNGICLDHPEKPAQAAAVWAKRILDEPRIRAGSKVAVFGFGSGYHLQELVKQSDKRISVIEPVAEVLRTAMQNRDLRELFDKLDNLSIGEEANLEWLEEDVELVLRSQNQSLQNEFAERLKSVFYGKQGLSLLKPSIAVVGPMQGGTLPIMGYCLRGLLSLGQRTRVIDVSDFAQGYHAVERIIFDKMRQNTSQGAYVEMMSQVILESINEKPVDIVICMAQAPLSARALTELRKKGIITVLWFVEDYLRFTYWKDMAQYYDFVFTIQRGECLDAIKAAGAGSVHYLPVACDPIIHAPLSLSEEDRRRWGSPLSFVGAGYHNRQQLFAALCEHPFKIWGTEWPNCKPFDRLVQESGRRLSPEEYIKIFNASDINLNLHSSSERDGVDPYGDFVNPRTFELAACGAFQLCDERQLLPEVFESGKEIATFGSAAELKDKIDYYLSHPEERREIARRGRERVLKSHTYLHRLKEMLSLIFAVKYEQIRDRVEKSPWKKMLSRAEPYPELSKRCKDAFSRGEEPNLDGLIADIVSGKGKLSETEQKLLFLYHIRKQIIRMHQEGG